MLKKVQKPNKRIIITFNLLFSIIMEGGSYFRATPHSNLSQIPPFTIIKKEVEKING